MKIVRIRIGKTRSVKVGDYRYFKPTVEYECEVDERDDDNQNDIVAQLSDMCDKDLDDIIELEFKREEYRTTVEDLKRILEENHSSEPEYKLAKKELQRLGYDVSNYA